MKAYQVVEDVEFWPRSSQAFVFSDPPTLKEVNAFLKKVRKKRKGKGRLIENHFQLAAQNQSQKMAAPKRVKENRQLTTG